MTKEVLDVSSLGDKSYFILYIMLCIEWPSYPFNVGTEQLKLKKKLTKLKQVQPFYLLSTDNPCTCYIPCTCYMYITNVHVSQNCKHGLAVFIITMTGKLIH